MNSPMTLRQLVYLAQLEDYSRERVQAWLDAHPGRVVQEKKKHLVWTMKARLVYIRAIVFSLVMSREQAVLFAIGMFEPLDMLLKTVFIFVAQLKLALFHQSMKTVLIAGSWGKTSCKETLFAMLSAKHRVKKTEGNVNTLMGIAQTVLRLPFGTEIFLCETDAFYRGEIAGVGRLVKPIVGILTVVGPMHLERFKNDMTELVQAQHEVLEAVGVGGKKFAPEDQKEQMKPELQTKTTFFEELDEVYTEVGEFFGLSADEVKHAKDQMKAVPHRNHVYATNGMTIIDDAYNSNPAGFRRALATLSKQKGSPKILVTPGMIEMGSVQAKENEEAAREAAKVCDVIIVVGETNKEALMAGAKGAKKLIWVKDLESAQAELGKIAKTGSVVLFENDLTDQYL
jgi:UDP-N-acetylmuramoyl-tripeptide--D-alanyl-D-alanine ligase